MTALRIPAVARRLLVLVALAPLIGCDGVDPQALLRAKLEAAAQAIAEEAAAGGGAEPIADRDPGAKSRTGRAADMDSIGPEDSMRIYYQFIDDGGNVHFVERLADVPDAWRDRVGFVEMDRPPPLTPLEARAAWSLSDRETATILARISAPPSTGGGRAGGRQKANVVLYFAEWCGYCKKAQSHLDVEGVDYEIRDVDIDAIARELREKTGRGGVPVLDYDGQVLRGYSKTGYEKAIREIRG